MMKKRGNREREKRRRRWKGFLPARVVASQTTRGNALNFSNWLSHVPPHVLQNPSDHLFLYLHTLLYPNHLPVFCYFLNYLLDRAGPLGDCPDASRGQRSASHHYACQRDRHDATAAPRRCCWKCGEFVLTRIAVVHSVSAHASPAFLALFCLATRSSSSTYFWIFFKFASPYLFFILRHSKIEYTILKKKKRTRGRKERLVAVE